MSDNVSINGASDAGRQSTGSVQSLLHLVVLWSFAVAQPLYSKFADNIPFLLAHRLDSAEVVAYALGILLAPPFVLWAFVLFSARLRRGLGTLALQLLVLVLVAVALFPVLKRVGLPEALALLASFGLGLIPALLYRKRFWSGLLDILVPAPLLFLAIFLFFTPVRTLLSGDEVQAGQGELDNRDIPVVILMLDEFSTQALLDEQGELDRGRLPGFARLADVSTWYPRATTVVEATVMAAPVILSGILPEGERHKPPVYQNFPENIFDQLSPDRRIWAVENGSRLCRPQRCETADVQLARSGHLGRWKSIATDTAIIYGHMVLPDRLRARWLPELGTRWAGFAGQGGAPGAVGDETAPRDIRWGQRQAEFSAFYEDLERVGPRSLHYLHLLMPHAPWIYLPGGATYDANRGDSINGMMPDSANDTGIKHMWWDDEWAAVLGEQRFLLQVHYVDRLVGRIVDRLSESEHFEEMMLVVVADHGGSFTPATSRRALTGENFAEILPIPLFIKYPGQLTGTRSEQHAELLDVSPTIRKALGLGVAGLDGRPLQNASSRPFEPRLVNEDGERLAFSEVDYEREFRNILGRMHERFAFSESGRFVLIEQWAEAYGQPLSVVGTVGPELGELVFQLDRAEQWQSVSPEGSFVPSRFLGRIRGEYEASKGLLVALNGRVAGFTRPFSYPDSDGLVEAMLWPELLQSGGNDLAVYAVIEEEPRVLLREIPVVAAQAPDASEQPATDSDEAATVAPGAGDAPIGDWIFPASPDSSQGIVLRGDWHPGRGGDIRWVGRQASACFDLGERDLPLELEFHAIPFLHEPELERQRLHIEIDGRSIEEISLEEERFRSYRVELGMEQSSDGGPLCIDFKLPDARVPRDLGASVDRRVLGAAFLKIRLIEQQQG
jgi:hypothetical protein